MTRKLKFLIPCLMLGIVAFTGCSDDDNSDGPTGGVALTSEQSKEKLSEIGQNLISLINAKDQEQLIKLSEYFSEIVGSLNIQEQGYDVSQLVHSLVAASKGDMAKVYSMTRATGEIYEVSDYYGIYTYNEQTRDWDYKESSSELALKFTYQKQNAEIKVAASEKTSDIIYEDVTVKVPANVTASIKLGTSTLTSFKINTANVSNSPRKANINVELDANGYKVSSYVSAGPDAVNANYVINIKGTEAIKGEARLKGNNITADEGPNEDIEDRFKDAYAEVNIMGEAVVAFNCSNYKGFSDAIDRVDEEYDNETENWGESQRAAQAFTDVHKQYLSGGLTFAGSDVESATLSFQPYIVYSYPDNGGTREFWDVEPLLKFEDESLISFDDYFDAASGPMKSLADSFEALMKSFEGFLE